MTTASARAVTLTRLVALASRAPRSRLGSSRRPTRTRKADAVVVAVGTPAANAIPPGFRIRRRSHREQGGGVAARGPGARHDAIVARGLAVDIQPSREESHGRVQSSETADDGLQQLRPVVVAIEMRLLVHHDLVQRFVVERVGHGARHEDDGPAESERARSSHAVGGSKFGCPVAAVASRDPQRQARFARTVEWRGGALQPPEGTAAPRDPQHADGGCHRPDGGRAGHDAVRDRRQHQRTGGIEGPVRSGADGVPVAIAASP